MEQSEEQWIPLMDYAMKRGVSLSTLRRQIKSKKVPFKIVSGRYLLLDGAEETVVAQPFMPASQDRVALVSKAPPAPPTFLESKQTLEHLNIELKKAHEEIAELKTLIAFYEESMFKPRMDV